MQINTEQEYQDALDRIELLMDAKEGTPGAEELEELAIAVEKYEDKQLTVVNDKGFPENTHWLDMTSEERKNFRKHQRETLGFDDSELPDLYAKISEFIAPRLKRFADFTMSHPINIDADSWVSQCKENARKLAGAKKEQCEAMRWIADNFEDLWSQVTPLRSVKGGRYAQQNTSINSETEVC